jgi:hypothetical protein
MPKLFVTLPEGPYLVSEPQAEVEFDIDDIKLLLDQLDSKQLRNLYEYIEAKIEEEARL